MSICESNKLFVLFIIREAIQQKTYSISLCVIWFLSQKKRMQFVEYQNAIVDILRRFSIFHTGKYKILKFLLNLLEINSLVFTKSVEKVNKHVKSSSMSL
mmetsp:Transcript_5264/g.21486  ORF Transcript_5264/g.21486 Transcript_5264/m.21486 type:complete len:100 (-) Transcript_5264:1231-1530(-)